MRQVAHRSHPPDSQGPTAQTTSSSRTAQPPPAPAFSTDDKRAGATRGPDPVHFRTGDPCKRRLDYVGYPLPLPWRGAQIPTPSFCAALDPEPPLQVAPQRCRLSCAHQAPRCRSCKRSGGSIGTSSMVTTATACCPEAARSAGCAISPEAAVMIDQSDAAASHSECMSFITPSWA